LVKFPVTVIVAPSKKPLTASNVYFPDGLDADYSSHVAMETDDIWLTKSGACRVFCEH